MPKIKEECLDQLNKSVPLTSILSPSQKYHNEYNCPFCPSTHHVTIFPENNVAHCNKCGRDFNAIQALEEITGKEFLEVVKDIAEDAGITLEYDTENNNAVEKAKALKEKQDEKQEGQEPPLQMPENTPNKYKIFIKEAADHVEPGREYLNERGISNTTIDAFKIGYTEKQYFRKAGKELPAIIFPYNKKYSYYSARSIEGKYFAKPNEQEAGREPLFNPDALYKKKPCFVCESILDALSIIEAGGNAVALNGTAYESTLLPYIQERKPEAPLILSLDNDKINEQGHRPGPEAQAALAEDLRKCNVPFINAMYNYSLYGGQKKDANDLLIANKEQLEADVNTSEKAALDDTGIEGFLFSISTRKYEPIPTGIKRIDKLLHGGFIPQSLVLLGSFPGAGKTILASMIFEEMAKAGRPGIYINLEMSKEQLIARSLSRRIYLANNRYKLTSLDILQGYKLTSTQKELVQEAADQYKNDVGNRLLYNPGGISTDLDSIMQYLESAAEDAEREGKPAPNVCIDYIHLLTGNPGEDTASVIKRAVFSLKDYAVKHNAVVLAIEAQSREASKKSFATLDAGRDSSSLEYSGDLILQLVSQVEGAPNEISLCVTKSRFTETNTTGFIIEKMGDVSYMNTDIADDFTNTGKS